MQTQKRQPRASVIERLLAQPYRFQFGQALRIIDAWLGKDLADMDVLDHCVRFRPRTSMAFPASEIEAIDLRQSTSADGQAAPDAGDMPCIGITPAFMAMLGSTGVLPGHYTDSVNAADHKSRHGGHSAFFELISHRPTALFYQAWSLSRWNYRRGSSTTLSHLPITLALAGHASRRAATPVPPTLPAMHAATMRRHTVTARMLASILGDYFSVPVAVEQFLRKWSRLPAEYQARLGSPHFRTDMLLTLGERVFEPGRWVRLSIGPLTKAEFDRWLPDGDCAKALPAVLALFPLEGLRVEVQLVLRAQDILPIRLGGPQSGWPRLGHGTFCITEQQAADREAFCYELD
jgi:type VI secretion system protein ImpH